MDTKRLDEFGMALMEDVRDYAAEEYLKMKIGKMKSIPSKKVFEAIHSIDSKHHEKLDFIVGKMIDNVIHKVLFMFEQSESFTIADKEKVAEDNDLVEYSDGLCGELYSEDGWYYMYSKNFLKMES